MANASVAKSHNDETRIIVHWLERSRSQRLLWLLEESKVDYEIRAYKRVDGQAPAEMKEAHPLGKSPSLTIQVPGQAQPLRMAESGFIFEYLVDYYAPHLAPIRYADRNSGISCDSDSWMRYRYYMHYTEGSLMPLLLRKHSLQGLEGTAVEKERGSLDSNLKTHLSFLESQIRSSPDQGRYLCGRDLTAADIMMSFPLMILFNGSSSSFVADYPSLDAYVKYLGQTPSFKASIEKVERASGEDYHLV